MQASIPCAAHAARLFDVIDDLVVVTGPDGLIQAANPAFRTLLGWDPDDLVGRPLDDFVHAEDLERTAATARRVARHGEPIRDLENRWRDRAGDWRWILWTGRWHEGAWYSVGKDVTERRAREQAAFSDHLTGTASRLLLEARLRHALVRLRRRAGAVAVVLLDLDDFKRVNDRDGHAAGDEVLRAVAARLGGAVRAEDVVARIGGDEFVIVGELDDAAEAQPLAARVADALAEPLELADRALAVRASIGVATCTDPATEIDELLRWADVAMYRAKDDGGGRMATFDAGLRAEVDQRLTLARDLQPALREDQMRLVYQPLVALADAAVVGCEALVRWDHPQLGELPPARFIPLAEDDGAIGPLGGWVLEEACRQARAWRQAGSDLTVSVNLSAVQLAGSLPDLVARTLRTTGLPPQALCLEVTETAIVEDPARAAEALSALRALGVRIAVDDFGTGHSSLAYLRRLPVDVVKIDRSFVGDLDVAVADRAVVAGIVAMTRMMGLTVIAEGVETAGQARALAEAGVPFAQGYWYGRPSSPGDLALDGFLPRAHPGIGDPFVIREFMRQIGIPARLGP